MRTATTSALTLAACFAACFTAGCGAPAPEAGTPYLRFQETVMATIVTVELPRTPGVREAAEEVFDLFERVDAEMSEWKETSPLAAVNRAAGREPVPVPAELRRMIRRGLEIGELTEGAFDLTWAALWGLWDFRAPQPTLPDPAEVARRLDLVDFRRVAIDDEAGTVGLPREGMKIGLGGIAKGYALDLAAAALRRRGIDSFLLVAGGQVMAGKGRRDHSSTDRPWKVGIRDPRGGMDDLLALLEITDTSVSTSGDYESFFLLEGQRYHHILDPRTGYPSRSLESATVVSPDATLADALSTALMVLGEEKGLALAEELPDLEAVVVTSAGRLRTTSGLAGQLRLLPRAEGE